MEKNSSPDIIVAIKALKMLFYVFQMKQHTAFIKEIYKKKTKKLFKVFRIFLFNCKTKQEQKKILENENQKIKRKNSEKNDSCQMKQ